jgi:N-dimethylarginine dimethylaminohydrolase
MPSVLFCDPNHFQIIDSKNPFMKPGEPLDLVLAGQQWESVKRAFEDTGFSAEVLTSVEGLEDMVFANNQLFVAGAAQGKFVVPSRMRFASRQKEVPHYVAWFKQRGYRIIELDFGDDYLEGHGDLLWHADFSKVWAGYGFRSTLGGVKKFSAAVEPLGIKVIPLELRDPRFYHLDTCFAPLTSKAVLVHPAAFTPQSYDLIQQNCERVYIVGESDGLKFVCNGVAAGGRFITPHLSPQLSTALSRERLEPVVVNTSEFQKSGGSVCCLKLFI